MGWLRRALCLLCAAWSLQPAAGAAQEPGRIQLLRHCGQAYAYMMIQARQEGDLAVAKTYALFYAQAYASRTWLASDRNVSDRQAPLVIDMDPVLQAQFQADPTFPRREAAACEGIVAQARAEALKTRGGLEYAEAGVLSIVRGKLGL